MLQNTNKTNFKPPHHLSPATRRWVQSVLDDYELEEHHFHLLVLAGELLDKSRRARLALEVEGEFYYDRYNQPHPHPAHAVERDSKLGFAKILRELGLDITATENPRVNSISGKRR